MSLSTPGREAASRSLNRARGQVEGHGQGVLQALPGQDGVDRVAFPAGRPILFTLVGQGQHHPGPGQGGRVQAIVPLD